MNNEPDIYGPDINPATGLPILDDTYIDVNGNPYSTDVNTWQPTYDPEPSDTFDPW